MKKKSYIIETFRLALPLAILGLGVAGFAAFANQREKPQSQEFQEPVPEVETIPVEVTADGVQVKVDGMVVPHREIKLSAEVAGRITRKYPVCKAGHYVTAGTPLLEIDQRTYQLSVARLQEEVTQAESVLAELEVELKNYDALIALQQEDVRLKQRDLQRAQQLFTQNVLNESDIDENRAAEITSRNSLVTLQNQRRMAEASRSRLVSSRELAKTKLEEARLDLEKSKIVAPIDGVIVTESVEEGNYVSAGTDLVTVEDTSAAEISTSLRMDEMHWIWQQGQSPGATELSNNPSLDYQLPQIPATVTYQLGNQQYEWDAMLWRYEGIGLNEQTRTVPVRLLVQNPRKVRLEQDHGRPAFGGPKALVRGMFVGVKIHTQPNMHFLQIPERAIQPGNVIWTVRDGKLHRIKLQNTSYHNGYVLVAENGLDLKREDQVVVTPLLLAAEGMTVQVKPSSLQFAAGEATAEGQDQ